jgi:tRNA(Ile)-lysidine synthase
LLVSSRRPAQAVLALDRARLYLNSQLASHNFRLMSLASRVLRTIRRHAMLEAGGRVVVALSGGPDSVALLSLLRDLEADGHLVVAGVAHFNHQLRGAAADADEQFCRDLADALHLPIQVGRADVRAAARLEKRSIEDAARRLRYAFLRGAAEQFDAPAVAVGHTLDDQAETFLLRLIRGAGTRGLGAIRPKAGPIIRPAIELSRAELRQFAADRRLSFQEDATNADLGIPRNRIRHELLPYLQREFSPNIVEVLARGAAVAREDDDRLEREAIELAASIVLTTTATQEPAPGRNAEAPGDRVVIDATELASLHPALGARVARLALEQAAGGQFVDFNAIQGLLDLARHGRPGRSLSLPACQGQVVQRERRVVVLGPEPARQPRGRIADGPESRFSLSIPGEVLLTASGLVISAEPAEAGRLPDEVNASVALVQGVQEPLTVRFRRPGDRFEPPGMGGQTKKLQDYLVDRKVPRGERDHLQLVTDAADGIVWIVGHAVADRHRVSRPSMGVILLIARHLGGEV